jgi:hypothetical protein
MIGILIRLGANRRASVPKMAARIGRGEGWAAPDYISVTARLLLLLTARSLRRLEISWLHVGDALDPR